MDTNTLVKEEFRTLRKEINGTRSRAFWIVAMGLFGIPILTYLAGNSQTPLVLLVPFSVLVLIVAYLSELSNMMRAARYIREHIEPRVKEIVGWEAWLESKKDLRLMDKHFASCLIVIFFAYYFVTVGITIDRFLSSAMYDNASTMAYWLSGIVLTYLIGALWALTMLIRHWRESVSTSTSVDKK